MRLVIAASGILALAFAAGCSDNSEHIEKLKAALDKAELSLADSVGVAETETADGVGIKAKLLVDSDPVFSVGALDVEALENVRVDIVSGDVLSVQAESPSADACPGAVSLNEAIAAAESAAGGDAVAIEPDDDGHCMREVKVLGDDDELWEVKIAADGKVLEVEADDDDYGDD
jgi:uncharacterized membrane protein YkoI